MGEFVCVCERASLCACVLALHELTCTAVHDHFGGVSRHSHVSSRQGILDEFTDGGWKWEAGRKRSGSYGKKQQRKTRELTGVGHECIYTPNGLQYLWAYNNGLQDGLQHLMCILSLSWYACPDGWVLGACVRECVRACGCVCVCVWVCLCLGGGGGSAWEVACPCACFVVNLITFNFA